MRVTVIDPPAYTPPYDHSLCAALAARGHEVELATSRFRHGAVPPPAGYRRNECFYRRGAEGQAAKALQHPLDMTRLARRLRSSAPAIAHFQWLPIPQLDRLLVRRFPRPRVLTAHDVLPREAGERARRAALAVMSEIDAVVVHTRSGRRRLVDLGVPSERVHVIPHGVFDYLASQGDSPGDLAPSELDGRKVVLFFGLIRPYKGLDILIEAFRDVPGDALLVVAGKPRMSIEPLRRRAAELGIADRVRFVDRFITDPEIPAYFRRADLVVLPYRETEQSGVLYSALAFARPTLVTDVGGFGEVAESGAVQLVPPEDPGALASAISALLADPAARQRLSEAARRAASGPYSWDHIAEATERLYSSLLSTGGAQ